MATTLARCVCVAALLVAIAVANTQMIPERHRHGRFFREALEAEKAHHAKLGFTPNQTASYFQVAIDHNNPSLGTFADRFFYDTTYWDGTGPCIFYLNGEAPCTSAVGGYMADIAQKFNACTVTIEHRWYGVSLPAPLTNKALLTATLTVDQAMRDVMALIKYFETSVANKPAGSITWMLIGGSYSGGMTVWMNEKYPGFFKASWAASGVVRATFAYDEYDGHVLTVTPGDCRDALARVMRIAEKKWDKSPADNARLLSIYNIPTYMTKTDFMWAMADISASCVQYGMKTDLCDGLVPLPDDDWAALEKYAKVTFDLFGSGFMSSCYYSTACLSNASMSSQWGPAGYSWIYETCNEMGWWQIGYTGSIRSPNITTSYFIEQCRAAFYNSTFPDTWAFNKRHHGYSPVTLGNIIATQGSDDPWSTTGLRVSQGPNFPVHTAQCTNCGHCGSMMSPRATDPEPLQVQRQLIMQYLTQWMSQ